MRSALPDFSTSVTPSPPSPKCRSVTRDTWHRTGVGGYCQIALARCPRLRHDGAVAVEREAGRIRAVMSDRTLRNTSVIAASLALLVAVSVLVVALVDQATQSTSRSEVFQPVTGTTRLGDPFGMRTHVQTRTHARNRRTTTLGVLLSVRQRPTAREKVSPQARTHATVPGRTRHMRSAASAHGRGRGRTRHVRGRRIGSRSTTGR
jgi:hypothetical protein